MCSTNRSANGDTTNFRQSTLKTDRLLFLLAVLATTVGVIIPLAPTLPSAGLDPSWVLGMNEAVARNMIFGKDIIFTFGPYASIYTKSYHPGTDALMVVGSSYLALSYSLALYLVFHKSTWKLKAGLLLTISTVMYSRDALLFFYPLLVALQVYKLAGADNGLAPYGRTAALIIAMFAPLGLIPLVKGSLLIASVAAIGFSLLILGRRRRWRLGALVMLAPVAAAVFFWLVSGQSAPDLIDYFRSLLPIISGYTEAMAVKGNPKEIWIYLIASAIVLLTLLFNVPGNRTDKVCVTVLFFCFLFLSFKAGFVRHDAHALASAAMIILVALSSATLLPHRSAIAVVVVALITWAYIDSFHMKTSSRDVINSLYSTYIGALKSIKHRINYPDALSQSYYAALERLKKESQLPVLDGTVDIYSYDQSYLIASGNNWNPRPVLQSYSAYTPWLIAKNRTHLLSDTRPDYVIIAVQPIDGRLPSLEDGASWPVLFSNYEPVTAIDEHLVLRHRGAKFNGGERLALANSGIYELGDEIVLPSSHGILFTKIRIKNNIFGEVLNALFKPSHMEIKLNLLDGATRRYRLIASMAESGVILSPVIENINEFSVAFRGAGLLPGKIVKSIEVTAGWPTSLWKPIVEVENYLLEFQHIDAPVSELGLQKPTPYPSDRILVLKERCDGNIDGVNGTYPLPKEIRTKTLLTVDGWLVESLGQARIPENVYLVLTDSASNHFVIAAAQTIRPDVATYFQNAMLTAAGRSVSADVSEINGKFELSWAYEQKGRLMMCPAHDVSLFIE